MSDMRAGTARTSRPFVSWFAAGLVLLAATASQAVHSAAIKRIEKLDVDSFTVDAAPVSPVGSYYWLDNNHLLCNLLPPGTKVQGNAHTTDLALVDFAAKKVKVLARSVALLEYDVELQEAYLGKWNGYVGEVDKQSPFVRAHIGVDGSIKEVERYPVGQLLPSIYPPPPTSGRYVLLGKKNAGYLVSDSLQHTEKQRFTEDVPVLTTWVKPGVPPLKLPIRFEEIDPGWVPFLPFLNKFLLNGHDTQASSSTNSHMNPRGWKRPYEYTPFRLLALNGSIEEIPYPGFLWDYGIADEPNQQQTNNNFGYFVISKAGILISKQSSKRSGIFLFKNNQLYQIAGAVFFLGYRLTGISTELAQTFEVSPDGCNVAYRHINVPSSQSKASDPFYITILNVCMERK